jgi:hypothetical protein
MTDEILRSDVVINIPVIRYYFVEAKGIALLITCMPWARCLVVYVHASTARESFIDVSLMVV